MLQTLQTIELPTWCRMPTPVPTLQVPLGNPSIVRLVSLQAYLPDDTAARLGAIEIELRQKMPVASILAGTQAEIEAALKTACEVAFDYYIEAGVLIWRGIGHDYGRLLELSRASSEALDHVFFEHYKAFQRDTFISAVAGLRALTNIGERTILWASRENMPPLEYLTTVLYVALLTTVVTSYLEGEVPTARPLNLRIIASSFMYLAKNAYKDAVKKGLFAGATETERMFWSPCWQKGEVEADLDKHVGNVRHLTSVESLLRDLR